MRRNQLSAILVLLGFLSAAGVLLAQNTPQDSASQDSADQAAPEQTAPAQPEPPAPAKTAKTFLVNGKPVNAQILDIDGRSYVDIDSLAQIALITNGSMTVEPNRIALTIPVAGSETPANAPASSEPPASVAGLSRQFVSIAIGDLAEMREWKAATGTMITYGLAVSDAWANSYHDRAQDGLTQATVAATTDDDRQALALLTNEFNKLNDWSGSALAARQALNGAQTIDPNTLQNDPTLAKITSCGDFLGSMLLSGAFSDNASCH